MKQEGPRKKRNSMAANRNSWSVDERNISLLVPDQLKTPVVASFSRGKEKAKGKKGDCVPKGQEKVNAHTDIVEVSSIVQQK